MRSLLNFRWCLLIILLGSCFLTTDCRSGRGGSRSRGRSRGGSSYRRFGSSNRASSSRKYHSTNQTSPVKEYGSSNTSSHAFNTNRNGSSNSYIKTYTTTRPYNPFYTRTPKTTPEPLFEIKTPKLDYELPKINEASKRGRLFDASMPNLNIDFPSPLQVKGKPAKSSKFNERQPSINPSFEAWNIGRRPQQIQHLSFNPSYQKQNGHQRSFQIKEPSFNPTIPEYISSGRTNLAQPLNNPYYHQRQTFQSNNIKSPFNSIPSSSPMTDFIQGSSRALDPKQTSQPSSQHVYYPNEMNMQQEDRDQIPGLFLNE